MFWLELISDRNFRAEPSHVSYWDRVESDNRAGVRV